MKANSRFFVLVVLVLGFFKFFTSPSPPNEIPPKISLEEFFERPNLYSDSYVTIQNVTSLGGSFFLMFGIYGVIGANGNRINVSYSKIPPPEGTSISEIKVYVQPLFSFSKTQLYILRQYE